MCDPISLSVASLVAASASSGISAYGARQAGQAQAAAANYNAKVAVDQGQAQANAAGVNAQQTYRQGDQEAGMARATLGANGVDVNSGTALQTQKDIGQRTGQNVANEQYNTQLAQWGALNQSTLDTQQAKYDIQAGDTSAVGSLLGGASQVAGKWSGFQQQGIL